MQSFRMREHVRLGKPGEVRAWRDVWIQRGLELLRSVGLAAYEAPANDRFFGRGGRLLAANQRQEQPKFELVLPITSTELPTAVMSFNDHQDRFSQLDEIATDQGEVARTACLGFGLQSLVLGLFKVHGFDPAGWPQPVREQLWY